MSKFQIKKRVDLGYLGEGWKECYLEFNTPGYGDVQEFIPLADKKNKSQVVDKGIDLIQKFFIGGKGFDGSGVIDITKDDLKGLPLDVLVKAFESIIGVPPKN